MSTLLQALFSIVSALAVTSAAFALEKSFFDELPTSTWIAVAGLCFVTAAWINQVQLRRVTKLAQLSEETLLKLEEIKSARRATLLKFLGSNNTLIWLLIAGGGLFFLKPILEAVGK